MGNATILTEEQVQILQNDLAELVGKIEIISEDLVEIDTLKLSNLNTNIEKIQSIKVANIIFATLLIFLLSGLLGYFLAYKITSNKLSRTNINDVVIAEFDKTIDVYLPRKSLKKINQDNDRYYIFTYENK